MNFEPETHVETPLCMTEDEAHPDKKANALHVFLVRGRRLPIMDKNMIGGGGSFHGVRWLTDGLNARLSLASAGRRIPS